MNFEEKISQVINNLRLIDDILFSACFEDNPRDVQYSGGEQIALVS